MALPQINHNHTRNTQINPLDPDAPKIRASQMNTPKHLLRTRRKKTHKKTTEPSTTSRSNSSTGSPNNDAYGTPPPKITMMSSGQETSGMHEPEIHIQDTIDDPQLSSDADTRSISDESDSGTHVTSISSYQKQKNFANILDNLCLIGLEAVVVISDRGVLLRANSVALDLTEYTQDEMVNHKINKLMPKYYRTRHDGYLLRYSRTLCPVILNRVRKGYDIIRKARFRGEPEDARRIPVSMKVTEIVDQNNQRYFVGCLRDERVFRSNEIHSRIVQKMYPPVLYRRVMENDNKVISGRDNCTAVFVDLVGFSSYCKGLDSSDDLVIMLNKFFNMMDSVVGDRGRFIKTIGDCYMYVCGLECCETQTKHNDHPTQAINIGLDALEVIESNEFPLKVRIGVCSGQAVYGIFGHNIPVFDVFGDVINIASRMETVATHGRVTVFNNVQRLCHQYFDFEERLVEIKGFKGKHKVYDVLGRKSEDEVYSINL